MSKNSLHFESAENRKFRLKIEKEAQKSGFGRIQSVSMRKRVKMLEVENIILCDVIFYILIRNLNLIKHNAVT